MKKQVFEKQEEKDSLVCYVLLYCRPIPRNKGLGPRCLFDYDDKTLLEKQVEEIKSINQEKEIILYSGLCFNKIFKQRTSDYRILDNPFFEETGSVEDIRLSVANSISKKFIFISDTYLSTKKDLLELSKESKIVTSKKNISDVKVIANGNLCKNINYTSGKNHLTGTFSLMGEELILFEKYLNKEYNRNKLYIEMLNFVIDCGGRFTILEKV
jgi:choline kinase